MPINLNPDALEAAHRHCADEGDIGTLARGLLAAAAQLEALHQPAPAPQKHEPVEELDEDDVSSITPSLPQRKKTSHRSHSRR